MASTKIGDLEAKYGIRRNEIVHIAYVYNWDNEFVK